MQYAKELRTKLTLASDDREAYIVEHRKRPLNPMPIF
jgi:hypothetical protein